MTVLQYIKGTLGLVYKSNRYIKVETYIDADYASNVDDRKYISRFYTNLRGNLVTWKSKKQTVVARSSCETEYRAMT